jgi:hypothetical protein
MRARQVKQTRYEAQLARIVPRTRQMNRIAQQHPPRVIGPGDPTFLAPLNCTW